MALSASIRLNPARGLRPVIRFPSTHAAAQHVLSVEFVSSDGRTWQAIGGGSTLAAAIAFARDGCPTDTTWQPVRWNDLYGD
jgi:hypothetical protein